MATFLLSLTPGRRDGGVAPGAFEALEASVAATGGALRNAWLLDGREIVGIVESPDAPSLARVLLELQEQGLHGTARPALLRGEAEALLRAHRERKPG